jgi:hypothetical protein
MPHLFHPVRSVYPQHAVVVTFTVCFSFGAIEANDKQYNSESSYGLRTYICYNRKVYMLTRHHIFKSIKSNIDLLYGLPFSFDAVNLRFYQNTFG